MDATKKFKELLDQIESSKLNYVMTKTPFSATISVKRSFVKYRGDSPEKEINVKEEDQPEKENEKLKHRLLSEHSENEKLQEQLEQQTAKVSTLEGKLRVSREELKNVKKEKNASTSMVKSLEKDLDSLKHHSREVLQTITGLENDVKEKVNAVKVKDAACMKFKKEKEELEKKISKALKLKEQANDIKFKCDLCDFYVESRVELGEHIKINHYKDHQCQTSEGEMSKESSKPSICEYPCFYCGYMIKTVEQLQKHVSECQDTGFVISGNISVRENARQLDMNEELEAYLQHVQKMAARVFKCDICEETFESEMLYGMHNVFTHARLG